MSFFFGGEKELLNVNSSVMPPGAEMPSLFQVCCWSDGSVVEGGVLAGILIFCFASWPCPLRQEEGEKKPCPVFRRKTKSGKDGRDE